MRLLIFSRCFLTYIINLKRTVFYFSCCCNLYSALWNVNRPIIKFLTKFNVFFKVGTRLQMLNKYGKLTLSLFTRYHLSTLDSIKIFSRRTKTDPNILGWPISHESPSKSRQPIMRLNSLCYPRVQQSVGVCVMTILFT